MTGAGALGAGAVAVTVTRIGGALDTGAADGAAALETTGTAAEVAGAGAVAGPAALARHNPMPTPARTTTRKTSPTIRTVRLPDAGAGAVMTFGGSDDIPGDIGGTDGGIEEGDDPHGAVGGMDGGIEEGDDDHGAVGGIDEGDHGCGGDSGGSDVGVGAPTGVIHPGAGGPPPGPA